MLHGTGIWLSVICRSSGVCHSPHATVMPTSWLTAKRSKSPCGQALGHVHPEKDFRAAWIDPRFGTQVARRSDSHGVPFVACGSPQLFRRWLETRNDATSRHTAVDAKCRGRQDIDAVGISVANTPLLPAQPIVRLPSQCTAENRRRRAHTPCACSSTATIRSGWVTFVVR